LSDAARGTVPAAAPPLPDGIARVREERVAGSVPLFAHPGWRRDLEWLVQGTTGHGRDGSFDLGLFGTTPVGVALERWRALRTATGMPRSVHSLQVHEDRVLVQGPGEPGLGITEGYDGHATSQPGVLLTVSIADCVPISLVDSSSRRIALLHGGWRGTALGILGAGLAHLGGDPSAVHVHLGPAICGRCYEVGPEVHQALGLAVPAAPAPVDVRAVLARQAVDAGVSPGHISVSEHCTRCGDNFFSHRAGSPGRQLGVLGLRP
jgi:polyphenol oxidase